VTFDTFEAPSFYAKSTNSIAGAESFYAFHIRLVKPGLFVDFDTVTINFPDGFDVSDARIVQALNNPTLIRLKTTLIFKYKPSWTNIETTIVVDGVKNPNNSGSYEIILTDKPFGPLRSNVSIIPFIPIPDNTIKSSNLAEDSITGRELAGVSKILFYDCRFKVVTKAGAARGIRYTDREWVTSFGLGAAVADASGVEEGDLVFSGNVYSGATTIILELINAERDRITTTFSNFGEATLDVGTYFSVPVIIIKK
jgi:hypothetical protein